MFYAKSCHQPVVGASFTRDLRVVGASFTRDLGVVGASFTRDLGAVGASVLLGKMREKPKTESPCLSTKKI